MILILYPCRHRDVFAVLLLTFFTLHSWRTDTVSKHFLGQFASLVFLLVICTRKFLDGQGFAALAEITTGMDVIDALYKGYGDGPRGPNQMAIQTKGNAYLNNNFPKLSYIKSCKLL